MSFIRFIPRLDIKGPNLVKGIHLEGLRVLGKPEEFAEYYYNEGADELLYMDVVASLYERNSLHDIITKTAKKIFIPLTVGGGIRSISDIRAVLRAGADKVSINTEAITNPQFIKEASRVFGSSTIVVAIEAIKQSNGQYLCYTDNGRNYTGMDALEWAQKLEELGVGEIIITSVDKEGTGNGFDIELTKLISEKVSVPIIAHGGPGKLEHIVELCKSTDISAFSVASMLHYDYIRKHSNRTIDNNKEGNLEFIKSGKQFGKITSSCISEIKDNLAKNGISIRPANEISLKYASK